jgi:hypothetical protein
VVKVSALIIGIDGWEQYTHPLIKSIEQHERLCDIVVIDNASSKPYPELWCTHHTERLCYSAAINAAHRFAHKPDWYIVLSNDVLCNGPFFYMLEHLPHNAIAGPHLMQNQGWTYLEGWCVCVPAPVWNALGGWDEQFQVSSWEDVDFSTSALEHGYNLAHCPDIPFIHLDQRQRFGLISNYWESEVANLKYFLTKHERSRVGA